MKQQDFSNEDKQFEDVINTLRSLHRKNAPDYFEADLMREIRRREAAPEPAKPTFWQRLFSPRPLLGASAGAAVLVLALLVVFRPSDQGDVLFEAPEPRKEVPSVASDNFEENIRQFVAREAVASQAMNTISKSMNDFFRGTVSAPAPEVAVRSMVPGSESSSRSSRRAEAALVSSAPAGGGRGTVAVGRQSQMRQQALCYRIFKDSHETQKEIDSLRSRLYQGSR